MAVYDGAKTALKLAADSGALRYHKDQYRNAEKYLRDGWLEIAHQKGRLAPFRDYQHADSLLKLASQTARDAQRQTMETIRNLDSLALSERAELLDELHTWRESLDGSLENFQAERHWTSAEFALNQADNLIRKQEFDEARKTLEKGRDELRNMENTVAEYANDEARKIGVWRQWVRETLKQSRANGTYALIIDKSAHKAHLVKGGDLVRSYNCELGYNSARQKLVCRRRCHA